MKLWSHAALVTRIALAATLCSIAADSPHAYCGTTSSTSAQPTVIRHKGDNISGSLQSGETILVVCLDRTHSGQVTFVNDNSTAHGRFEIAIAQENLPATSPNWVPVEGSVTFRHKRLFTVSLFGIEARYLRLRFHVEGDSRA